MKRRSFLIGAAATSIAGVSAGVQVASAATDPIREKYPQLYKQLVAYASNDPTQPSEARDAAYAQYNSKGLDPRAELVFRRNRIAALSELSSLTSSNPPNPASLTQDELNILTLYVRGSDFPHKPSLVGSISNYLGSADDSTLFDIMGSAEGVAGILIGLSDPPAGAALGIAAILTPYIDNVTNLFIRPVSLADAYAVGESVPMHPLLRRIELKAAFGIPADTDSKTLIDRLPPSSKYVLRNALEAGDTKSPDALTSQVKIQHDQLNELFGELRQNIVADMKSQFKERDDKFARRYYIDGEIRGSIYLGTTILREVFGDDRSAHVFQTVATESYNVYRLFEGFAAETPTVGALGLTGGFVSSVFAIAVTIQGISEQEMLQQSLTAIHEAIRTLRDEMHERFNRIERNQRLMMDTLGIIVTRLSVGQWEELARLRNLQQSLNGLRNYIESQDRQEKINSLHLQADNLRSAISAYGSVQAALNVPENRSLLNFFSSYAQRTAKEPAFTHVDLVGWGARSMNDLWETTQRPDLLIGAMVPIRQRLGLPGMPDPISSNPVEWARSTNLLLEQIAISDVPLPLHAHDILREMFNSGVAVRNFLGSFTDPQMRLKLADLFMEAFGEVTDLISLHYGTFTREAKAKHVFAGSIPGLGDRPYDQIPGEPEWEDGKASWKTDEVIFFKGKRVSSVKLNEQLNPIEAAIDVGLIEEEPLGSYRLGDRTKPALVTNVRLRFRGGRWADMVTTKSNDGATGIQKVKYDHRPAPSWLILPRTKVVKTDPASRVAEPIGADVLAFLTELRREVASHHQKLQMTLVERSNDFLVNSLAGWEEFRALGGVIRLVAALTAWGQAAPLDQSSSLFANSRVTYSNPAAISDALKQLFTGFPKNIGDRDVKINQALVDGLTDLVRVASTTLLNLERNEAMPIDVKYQLIEGTLLKLRGLAHHHQINLAG